MITSYHDIHDIHGRFKDLCQLPTSGFRTVKSCHHSGPPRASAKGGVLHPQNMVNVWENMGKSW